MDVTVRTAGPADLDQILDLGVMACDEIGLAPPDRDLMRDLHYELLEAMERHGAEIVSDFDRQEFGLPPRGPDGWTMEEIVALEQRRMEMLTRPIPPMIIQGVSRIP